MRNNFLVFLSGHCTHIGAIASTTLSQPKLPMEIAVFRFEKNTITQKMVR